MLEMFPVTVPLTNGEEERTAYVYVPDSKRNRRYPVLYMFDGHNVFLDSEATYGKSWGMLEYLEKTKTPIIVAAVECSHHGEREECGGRLSEYSPFDFNDPHWGMIKGNGRMTMDWLVNEFKPLIDENYPTKPGRNSTFIAGSSMGGLMTIYALMEYNDTFGGGAALSPSVGFNPPAVFAMIDNAEIRKTVMYMDYGENEFRRHHVSSSYLNTVERLLKKDVLLTSRIVPNGEHCEASWEKQIPLFMRVLLYER